MKRLVLIGTLTTALAASASGEDRFPSKRPDTFEWGLGLGALIEDEGYRNIGFETNGTPILYLANKHFRFFANQLDVHLVNTSDFTFSVKAEARSDGFDPDDDDYFDGMEEREGGIFAGVRTEYKTSLGNLVAEWQRDVSGKSEGAYGAVGSYWTLDTAHGQWVPKIALEYYNSKYTHYYYAVTAAEVASDRPAYDPGGSAIHIDIGVDYLRKLTDRHQIMASIKYRHYDSAVSDSPLVDGSGSPRFVLGYLYNF